MKFSIVNRVHQKVITNLLGQLIVVFQLKSLDKHVWTAEGTATVVHTTLTIYIIDSRPWLECSSSASSIYTALEQVISSFSLCLMLVTNGSKVTVASKIEWYSHKTSQSSSVALILVL